MKKTKTFKIGDKVFAKVKGYPPWPARIVAENGKKYNVEFYGTKETGVIKVEDIYYYLKNKDTLANERYRKRSGYVEAMQEIEAAIEKDGGDGDENPDESIKNGFDTSNSSAVSNTSASEKKPPKRKRDSAEDVTPGKRGRRKKSSAVSEGTKEEEDTTQEENEMAKETEFVAIESNPDINMKTEEVEDPAIEEESVNKEQDKSIETKVEVVSEKYLNGIFAYAKHVKEKESLYKSMPVEPRDDNGNQVLPVKLPSGTMAGIKIHKNLPPNFENEYDRALHDETVAKEVLERKRKLTSGERKIEEDTEWFVPNIHMSMDDVNEITYEKDIEAKKSRIERLKVEASVIFLDSKIKSSLGLDKTADPKTAVEHLKELQKVDFDMLMLKKHCHVVEMTRRLRKYIGNTKEWNLSKEESEEFSKHAERVRAEAEKLYNKMKEVSNIPDDVPSFWDSFLEIVGKFRTECKNLTESEVYVLCAEPNSRKAFLDELADKEPKEVSNRVELNPEPAAVQNKPGDSLVID